MANEASRIILACAMVAVPQFTVLAVAETLMHRAENQVPVAIVRIERTADHTEIHLQMQAALEKVCFAATGPNSPFLLANGQSYRYLGGDTVAVCPQRCDYAAGDVVVLRFAPLEAGTSTFSLAAGGDKRSGEAISPAAPSWNFVRVILN